MISVINKRTFPTVGYCFPIRPCQVYIISAFRKIFKGFTRFK